jgi:hypothetical protein
LGCAQRYAGRETGTPDPDALMRVVNGKAMKTATSPRTLRQRQQCRPTIMRMSSDIVLARNATGLCGFEHRTDDSPAETTAAAFQDCNDTDS